MSSDLYLTTMNKLIKGALHQDKLISYTLLCFLCLLTYCTSIFCAFCFDKQTSKEEWL